MGLSITNVFTSGAPYPRIISEGANIMSSANGTELEASPHCIWIEIEKVQCYALDCDGVLATRKEMRPCSQAFEPKLVDSLAMMPCGLC